MIEEHALREGRYLAYKCGSCGEDCLNHRDLPRTAHRECVDCSFGGLE